MQKSNKRILFCLILSVYSSLPLFAQKTGSEEDEFADFRKEIQSEYDDFRREINREYADFLSKAWEEYRLFQGKSQDEVPKPLSPVLFQEENNRQEMSLVNVETQKGIPLEEKQADQREKKRDEKQEEKKVKEVERTLSSLLRNPAVDAASASLCCDYFGAELRLQYEKCSFDLSTVAERSVGNLWKDISDSRFSVLLADMIRYKKEMQMNDWAYFLLTEKVAARLSTLQSEDCRTVFQHFLLVQSGYDVRLARVDRFLVLLLPVREEVYARPFLTVDGKQYYVISNRSLKEHSSIFTYKLPDKLIQKAYLSLAMDKELLLPVQPKPFCIKAEGVEVKGEVNVNKIRFYREYLSCELAVYARAVPDERLSKQLFVSLSACLKEKPRKEALNLLLTWVQKGFNYQTDGEQFGYEKPFFIEENFFYPACDCEDRAMLFAYLVHRLFGREVVLLDYPGHVATAVCIEQEEEEIKGAYLLLKGKKYIVCDPTYIDAEVGMVMPSCKGKRPKVIRL